MLLCCVLFLLAGCGSSGEEAESTEPEAAVAKVITDIDDDLGMNLPLGLDNIRLLEDGTLILETDDALEDAVGEEITVASDAEDVFVVPFGNGGYRSVVFIREDGSVSALNTAALINDLDIEVMDNLGGYEDVKTIESVQDPEASLVNAVMNNGDAFLLDPYLK